jgi:hypothetical protein
MTMAQKKGEIINLQRFEGEGNAWYITWKAWRDSEPGLIGQGVTPDRAIEDLGVSLP